MTDRVKFEYGYLKLAALLFELTKCLKHKYYNSADEQKVINPGLFTAEFCTENRPIPEMAAPRKKTGCGIVKRYFWVVKNGDKVGEN